MLRAVGCSRSAPDFPFTSGAFAVINVITEIPKELTVISPLLPSALEMQRSLQQQHPNAAARLLIPVRGPPGTRDLGSLLVFKLYSLTFFQKP